LEQISYQILREEGFIADFLQINEARLTFADYMGLDNYYRRQAARTSGLSVQTYKLVRGAMDLIFGFLPLEVKSWIDNALAKDSMYGFVLSALHARLSVLQTDHWHSRYTRTFFGRRRRTGISISFKFLGQATHATERSFRTTCRTSPYTFSQL
jgi:hypothetical protein